MAKVSLRAYNQEIEAMIDRGHLDEAIAHCKHILKTFPKHLETYRLLGKAYLEYKRYPEAADIFSRVLVSVPSDFVANVGLSIIRDEENKLDDAIWHMERAFETQPSNAAIQSELQRLYGRREGVQPPRIRMTRGALAHMYVQGELYPQAISEIKSVLKEDPGRNDMQVLLAQAYYRSGLKNDAAEVASLVLRSNPYNLDANRVLVEILGVDHPESVQAYRQRVVELDPYAAQVSGSIFLSNEVPDAAVNLEHLDWNGQPVGIQPDWESAQAISLESGQRRDEQPDWLRNTFSESPGSSQLEHVTPFDAAPPSAKPVEPEDNIPDFLREAGWGAASGAFDESKSPFAESALPSDESNIEQGELPDWVKALAPQQPAENPAEEELPDWISQIGTSALPISSPEEHPDSPPAARSPRRVSEPGAAESGIAGRSRGSEPSEQPDWMNQFDQPSSPPAEDQPDWLKGFGASEQPAEPVSEEPDWLKGFESESVSAAEAKGELDWLGQLGQESGSKESESSSNEFDFLNELSEEKDQLAPSAVSENVTPPLPTATSPGISEEEQEDAFAWLENLAAKQGATEGLLTTPEERREEEPEWLKGLPSSEVSTTEPRVEEPPVAETTAALDELGKTEQERDDSFAWLESLAAKQGASEGLLTTPEERREEEPEWVRQAKSLGDQSQEVFSAPVPEVEQPSVTEPASALEDLGKSEQERDDAFAWLESLAAKQGASEGLLTKPEERMEEEPEWVKHAKDAAAQQPFAEVTTTEPSASLEDTEQAAWLHGLDEAAGTPSEPQASLEEPDWMQQSQEVRSEEAVSADDTRVWLRKLEEEEAEEGASQPEASEPLEETPAWMQPGEEPRAEESPPTMAFTEQAPSLDETAAWLKSLEEEDAMPSPEPVSSRDDTAVWLKSLEEQKPQEAVPESAESMQHEELPAWMQDIEAEKPAEESASPVSEFSLEAEGTEWMSSIEEQPQPAAPEPPKVETGSLPSWLRGLEQEEEASEAAFAAHEDLPAWLRDETGEVVAEPTKIEPTRTTDWQPMEAKQPEPEPIAAPPQPEAEAADVVAIIEEKISAVTQEPERPTPPAKPRKEPLKPKGTGPLDPVLGQARGELSRSNLPAALESYDRLIKKGRFLEDVIYDLREASYRYPVDVNILQSLGDAYMRSNRLQDALEAYTKAEELLR